MAEAISFSGQRILVTGASSGIGRASAILLSQLGARVTLVARRTEALEETRALLAGEAHDVCPFDLSSTDEIPGWLKGLSTSGPFSGVFHSAGVSSIMPVALVKSGAVDAVFGSSVKACFGLARGFAGRGVGAAAGSSLVFMSSVASLRGTAGMSVYSAAKAAIDGAARSLACELAPRSIRVNTIAAGAVKTQMHVRIVADSPEDSLKAYEKRHLLGFGEPADVAWAAAFLLSRQSKWITGTALVVDGGYSCR